jgi:hypothetical protein
VVVPTGRPRCSMLHPAMPATLKLRTKSRMESGRSHSNPNLSGSLWLRHHAGFRRGREFLRRATGANGFEAPSISEELAQSVALGDVQHLCMFHLTQ